jgi:hypothetical protein
VSAYRAHEAIEHKKAICCENAELKGSNGCVVLPSPGTGANKRQSQSYRQTLWQRRLLEGGHPSYPMELGKEQLNLHSDN